MRAGNVLSFDPLVAATNNGQIKETGAGGGNVGGNGTYYSLPSTIDTSLDVGEIIKLTGTLAGTLTVEVDNNLGDDADRLGNADWNTYTKVQSDGFVDGVATLAAGVISGANNPTYLDLTRIPFSRYRLKLVTTGGTGTIRCRRQLKGA